jgi:hypothetical protein
LAIDGAEAELDQVHNSGARNGAVAGLKKSAKAEEFAEKKQRESKLDQVETDSFPRKRE